MRACAVYPDLLPRQLEVPLAFINSSLGLELSPGAAAKLLQSMQLSAAPEGDGPGALLRVGVPITRSDILHACDVMEDVAIAYGYNNLAQQVCCTLRAYTSLLGVSSLLRTLR